MSFTISNLTSNQGVVKKKLESLRVAHKKLDNQSQTSKVSSTPIKPRISDTLRFELSTLNQKSVEMQNDISKGFSTNVALTKLSKQVDQLKFQDSNQEQSLDDLITRQTFEGKQVLNQKDNNSSSNNDIQAVTTSRPTKIGSYSISIFENSKSSANEVQYTVDISSGSDYKKSVTTSLTPATGLISGIEIYYDKTAIQKSDTKSIEAQIEVKESKAFSISNFKDDLQRVKESSSKQDFEDKVSQLSSKIKTNQNLITKDIESIQSQYQSTQNISENLSASDNASFDLSKAAQLVNQTQKSLLQSPETTSNLFYIEPSDTTAKGLLE
ncbi:MAG: hypothetical protein COB02_04515 [Candidatus Cloacimonadota bacterium]|nr:MAG: hypothetical protein COB02_04515 [Candidatus Cloacimonadota bacterium]